MNNKIDNVPLVALWKIWGLRLVFLMMAAFLGPYQFLALFGETAHWSGWQGAGHSIFAALSLIALLGVFHPLKLLPVMLFELIWKTLWLLAIAMTAWLEHREIPDILDLWATIIGVVIMIVIIPWRYTFWSYFVQPVDLWRKNKNEQTK